MSNTILRTPLEIQLEVVTPMLTGGYGGIDIVRTALDLGYAPESVAVAMIGMDFGAGIVPGQGFGTIFVTESTLHTAGDSVDAIAIPWNETVMACVLQSTDDRTIFEQVRAMVERSRSGTDIVNTMIRINPSGSIISRALLTNGFATGHITTAQFESIVYVSQTPVSAQMDRIALTPIKIPKR